MWNFRCRKQAIGSLGNLTYHPPHLQNLASLSRNNRQRLIVIFWKAIFLMVIYSLFRDNSFNKVSNIKIKMKQMCLIFITKLHKKIFTLYAIASLYTDVPYFIFADHGLPKIAILVLFSFQNTHSRTRTRVVLCFYRYKT